MSPPPPPPPRSLGSTLQASSPAEIERVETMLRAFTDGAPQRFADDIAKTIRLTSVRVQEDRRGSEIECELQVLEVRRVLRRVRVLILAP